MTLTVGSLFTGYGGLELAVQQVLDTDVAWHCENDAAASRVLKHHWPDVPNLGNITTADWALVEPVDMITAGWPCQPFSLAGKRKGTIDDRALWPYVADAVRVVRPRHVFLENVAAIVTAGELARAVTDLAALGYVGSWTCVRAADAGAPHKRERCFIFAADTDSETRGTGLRASQPAGIGARRLDNDAISAHSRQAPSDATRNGRSEKRFESAWIIRGPVVNWGPWEPAIRRWERILGRPAPTPYDLNRDDKPRLTAIFPEWMMGLPPGWVTDVSDITRNQQLAVLGNGVCPQQAALALRTLLNQVTAP